MEKAYLCPICQNGSLEDCSEALDSGECSSCDELSYFSEATEISKEELEALNTLDLKDEDECECDEVFSEITDTQLLEMYNSDNEIVIRLNDGTIIHTDDDEVFLEYEKHPEIHFAYFLSDFMQSFSIKDELIKRGLIKKKY